MTTTVKMTKVCNDDGNDNDGDNDEDDEDGDDNDGDNDEDDDGEPDEGAGDGVEQLPIAPPLLAETSKTGGV